MLSSGRVARRVAHVLLLSFLLESQLIQSNQLHSIKYNNKQSGIDYYYANQHHLGRKTVATNLKSVLPGNLANKFEGESLPQVANTLAVVRGNGPRRQAKQVQGFEEQQPSGGSRVEPLGGQAGRRAESSVCLTPGCVKAAAEILKNIDDKVDPCDDFYRYSCGNWIESQVIPEDKTSVSLFSVVQDELDNKLRNLIERQPSALDAPIVAKMRNLYESCMNTSKWSGRQT